MTTCPRYVAPFEAQLGHKYGGTNCTAVAASRVVAEASCGKAAVSGPRIRSLSSEPVPDPRSPGLNIPQVVAVIEDDYHIPMDVFVGARALTWAQYEARRAKGEPAILQLGYGPIAASPQDAGRGFAGNHAVAETTDATYDPLADGRPGAWKFDGRLYSRPMMRDAAAALQVGSHRAGPDAVWCAFAPDVVSETMVEIRPPAGQRKLRFAYNIVRRGVITGVGHSTTGGFSARARLRCVPWPERHDSVYRLQLLDGSRAGMFVPTKWEMT